jgi:1-aminocyclopropane-1-carboxylate deaminase
MLLQPDIIPVQTIAHLPCAADVLRLDTIHPVVSGNKWFKLEKYLEEAKVQGKSILLTFGGAFSNHIVATAAAAQMEGLGSIGIIRGEEPKTLSFTLQEARSFGMELKFVSREDYDHPERFSGNWADEATYVIPAGGYGSNGARGAKEILSLCHTENYSHILCAVGTGTMLAGLVLAALPHQQVTGISSMKGNISLQEEVNALLPAEKKNCFTLLHDFHFGGFAKHGPELFSFMNDWYQRTGIPCDFVYTGKLFFALDRLSKEGYFPLNSRILVVHSGGLQGNRSLPKGTLIF